MSLSHLCPRCGGWHAVSGPCHAGPTPGNAFGMAPRPASSGSGGPFAAPQAAAPRQHAGVPAPLLGRSAGMIAAQAEADAAEAAAIHLYHRLFGSGGPAA